MLLVRGFGLVCITVLAKDAALFKEAYLLIVLIRFLMLSILLFAQMRTQKPTTFSLRQFHFLFPTLVRSIFSS